ncbi:hypothetical protein A9Q99_10940 [Gammaproteobacteria bacterium 45_16_T64]|nr:hypothetical protein A9Q99_10940 [Gammaproteobacteria bacterium 45_16_T64]
MKKPSLPKRRIAMLGRLVSQIFSQAVPLAAPTIDRSAISRLHGRLEFVRDNNGVAHLYAEVESDLYIGVGYLQAVERFMIMDTLRHVATGRLSELFANIRIPASVERIGGLTLQDFDAFLRPLGFEQEALRDFPRLPIEEQRCLEAFAQGVNDALIHMNGVYPPEMLFTGKLIPWTAEDCLLAARASALIVSLVPLENELTFDNIRVQEGDAIARMIYPDAPWDDVPDYCQGGESEIPDGPLDPPNMGSNNWAVTGKRSRSGAPIVCNDPHVPVLPAPTYWQHVHLECPQYSVQGGMFPGYPGMGFGHNGHIAWGCTTVFRDAWDLSRIQRAETHSDRYLTSKGTESILHHRATLNARFGRSREVEWESCRHGIIYPEWRHPDGTELALKFVACDHAAHFSGHRALYSASSVEDTQSALAKLNGGPFDFNMVYAHKDGHIAWEQIGQLPRRAKDGLFIRDSSDPNTDWDGYLDFSENPKIINPDSDMIVTANTDTCPKQFPKIATRVHCEPRHRQERIIALLNEKQEHDWKSMALIQRDVMAVYAEPLRDMICEVLGHYANTAGLLAEASVSLEQWDCQFTVDSVGATIFTYMRKILAQTVFGAVLGSESAKRFTHGQRSIPRIELMILDADDPLRELLQEKTGNSIEFFIQQSFEQSVNKLMTDWGDNLSAWRWGNIHRVRIGSPLAEIPRWGKPWEAIEAPMPGEANTISPSVTTPDGKRLRMLIGASSRFICDLGKPKEAWFAHSTGPVVDPHSPLYKGLADKWHKFEYFRSALWKADKVPNVRERVILIP